MKIFSENFRKYFQCIRSYHGVGDLSRGNTQQFLYSVKNLPFNYTPAFRENQAENSENLMQIFQKIFRKFFQVLSVPDRSGFVKGQNAGKRRNFCTMYKKMHQK